MKKLKSSNKLLMTLILAALAFMLTCSSCNKTPVECDTDFVFDREQVKQDIAKKPPIDSVFVPAMRLQFNMFHPSDLFDFDTRVSKVPALLERIDAHYRFFDVVNASEYVYTHVVDFGFDYTIDDIRRESKLRDSLVNRGHSTCALNVNFVPDGTIINGFTIPGWYPDPKGNCIWVSYRVLDVKRPEWITTTQHEMSHALGENHLTNENGDVLFEHAINDNMQSYAQMRCCFTMEQESRMYEFLLYLRENWWRECEEDYD